MAEPKKTLPPVLASLIPSLRWSLNEEASAPMLLQSLEQMKLIRSKQQQCQQHDARNGEASPPSSCSLDPSHPFLQDLPAALQALFPIPQPPPAPPLHHHPYHRIPATAESTSIKEHSYIDCRRAFGRIAVALILLGHGLTDEAHDIVLPFSFPQHTDYGGQSLYEHVSEAVRTYASYVHSMVHRREANHRGEFDTRGFDNADFWSGTVFRSPGLDELPHQDLFDSVGALIRQHDAANRHAVIRQWLAEHDEIMPVEGRTREFPFFESRAVHRFCALVLEKRDECHDEGGDDDDDDEVDDDDDVSFLTSFAERVAEVELRVLLYHVLVRSGYQVSRETILLEQRDLFGSAVM